MSTANEITSYLSKEEVESESPSLDKSSPSLPVPPAARRWMSLGSLALVGVAALLVAVMLWPAARFSLHDGPPTDLGILASATLNNPPEWATASGTPSSDALSFRRRGNRGSSRLVQIEERPEFWVVLPVPRVAENNYVPPSRFTGRLIELGDAALKHRPIVTMIEERQRVPGGQFILFHGQTPKTERSSLWAFLLLTALGTACLTFSLRLGWQFPS